MTNWTELKRLAERNNAEEWQARDEVGFEVFQNPEGGRVAIVSSQADMDFIAAANPKTILALIAENERLRDESHKNRMDFVDEVERRDKLRAEVEALRKDAERYRWLRAHHGLSLKGHDFISYGEVADFRIDNAMTVVKADG